MRRPDHQHPDLGHHTHPGRDEAPLPNCGALADRLTTHGYWPDLTQAAARALHRARRHTTAAGDQPTWLTHERIDPPA